MGHYDTAEIGMAWPQSAHTALLLQYLTCAREVHIPFCSLVSVVCEGVREEEWSASSSSKDWNVEKVGEPRGWRPGEGGGQWTCLPSTGDHKL